MSLFGCSHLFLSIILPIIRVVIHVLKWWFYYGKSTSIGFILVLGHKLQDKNLKQKH